MSLKKFNYLLLLSLLITSCGTKSKYTISANISGVEDGNIVYLRDNESTIDSASFKNKKVTFSGKIKHPELYNLLIVNPTNKNPNYYSTIPIFLTNGKAKIEANIDSLPKAYQLKNSVIDFNNYTLTGMNMHNEYVAFQEGLQPLIQSRKNSFRKYLDHLNYGKPFEEIHNGIELVKEVDNSSKIRDNYIKEYILNHPNSYISLHVLSDNFRSFSENELDTILRTISPNIINNDAGQKVISTIKNVKTSSVGAHYTDLMLQDTAGNTVSLNQLVEKGKYTLLEFWASWCMPCRFDIPHLKHVYELYNKAGFNIVSISMDHKKDDWVKAVKDENMPWIQVSELKGFKGDVSNKYHFSGIPTAILIDPNGKIVTRNMRGSWMDGKLIELFGDKF